MTSPAAGLRDYELSPVKFSRLTRRGVLLGLSGSQLVVVGIGAITLVFALYLGGGMSLVYVLPLLLLCVALAWVGVGGRKLIAWLPIVLRWMWRASGTEGFRRGRGVGLCVDCRRGRPPAGGAAAGAGGAVAGGVVVAKEAATAGVRTGRSVGAAASQQ